MRKFAHLLIRERGFVIFTDNRNLTYIQSHKCGLGCGTARSAGKVLQFASGEFVLITAAVPRSKLRVRWLGPF